MKITIDIPGELLLRAKAVAALRGESLGLLILRSLRRELGPARVPCHVHGPDAADTLMCELQVLATQVSAAWVGTRDAVDTLRDQRRGCR